ITLQQGDLAACIQGSIAITDPCIFCSGGRFRQHLPGCSVLTETAIDATDGGQHPRTKSGLAGKTLSCALRAAVEQLPRGRQTAGRTGRQIALEQVYQKSLHYPT